MQRFTKLALKLPVVVVVGVMIIATASAASAASATTSRASGQKYGGTLVLGGGATTGTVLDPTQTGFAQPGAPTQLEELGSLFENPYKSGGAFIPDLAESYSFNKSATVFTMQLRPNLEFADGTPLNAKAVAWNWSAARDGSQLSFPGSAGYFVPVSSVETKGKYTVIVRFNQPDAVWISQIAAEPLGLMLSPTALAQQGQSQFDLTPVGAGAFYVTQNIAEQQITLTKNPHYWNSKTVYLQTIIIKAIGSDPTTAYEDLESGAIGADPMSGDSTPPNLIQEALSSGTWETNSTPNYGLIVMTINTWVTPFNNLLAREALDYCLDRTVIANNLFAGYSTPAWIYAGPAVFWYPTDAAGKASLTAAQKLLPYQYNVSKGSAIVSQLGGLSFTFDVLNLGTSYVTLGTEIAQQWAQCGINATVTPVAPAAASALAASGAEQIGLSPTGNANDPRLVVKELNPAETSHGFDDPVVTKYLQKSFAATNPVQLKVDWTNIWTSMDKNVDIIPVISAPSFNIQSKCIHNTLFNYGTEYDHAWLSCDPSPSA